MPERKERDGPIAPPPAGPIARAVKDPVSRRKFMALTGGSVALGALLAACGSDSGGATAETSSQTSSETEQFGKGDIGILNYALTLEYLETALYDEIVKSGLFRGTKLEMLRKFGSEEAEHVAALNTAVKQMGGTPAPIPKTEFPLKKNAKSALELALTIENLGAAAYLGQLSNIESRDVLASVLSIHSVEGRHTASLNKLNGEPFTQSGALERPLDAATVLLLAEPFITG